MFLRVQFVALALLVIYGFYGCANGRKPTPPTPIFRGVTYTCLLLPDTDQTGGVAHLVKVDLATPGLEIFTTPVDPGARADGWEYRLRYAGAVARRERLSVVVNGTLFSGRSMRFLPLPGDGANSVETIVSDGAVNHIWEHTYLLWFDKDLVPRVQASKPPSEEVLRDARWAIGGQAVALSEGRLASVSDEPDRRTMLGIDTDKRLLWIAVFEHASTRAAAQLLAEQGARDAIALDGGESTTMVIGAKARNVRRGVLVTGWRPVATFFGVRAPPLPHGR